MANKENIAKWVAALRSGQFQQTTQKLHGADGKYCCLGVACKVALDNGLHLAVDRDEEGKTSYDDDAGELPPAVARWLGLEWEDEDGRLRTESDPSLRVPNAATMSGRRSAIELNDTDQAPFSTIADAIEFTYLRVPND